jgi:hypothetical protein
VWCRDKCHDRGRHVCVSESSLLLEGAVQLAQVRDTTQALGDAIAQQHGSILRNLLLCIPGEDAAAARGGAAAAARGGAAAALTGVLACSPALSAMLAQEHAIALVYAAHRSVGCSVPSLVSGHWRRCGGACSSLSI